MKLTILIDNMAGKCCGGEYGLSYVITEDKTILFDTGHTDLFLRNAETLNISINDIDTVVLSHGHWDHGNGLQYLDNKTLVCHPEVFTRRYKTGPNGYYDGLAITQEDAEKKFRIVYTKAPYIISDRITFLGEIPRRNDFEAKKTPFATEERTPDFIMDDSALAITSPNGLIVVAGCSHAGICNIIDYAKEVTGISQVYAVIGGFHLLSVNDILYKTISKIKEEKIQYIYPAHCTAFRPMTELSKHFNIDRLKSGDIIEL